MSKETQLIVDQLCLRSVPSWFSVLLEVERVANHLGEVNRPGSMTTGKRPLLHFTGESVL
jgi:hypothetical protein